MKLSIYLAEDSVRLVACDRQRPLHVSRCMDYRLHPGTMINGVITDEAAVQEVLLRIAGEHPRDGKHINLVLGSSKIITKVLQVPDMPRRYLLQLARRELSGFVDKTADVVYDYCTLGGEQEGRRGGLILCAAVDREQINGSRRLFEECGLKVRRIDIALNAAARLVEALPAVRGGSFLVSILDGRTMMSLLYEAGRYVHSSRIRLLSERGGEGVPGEMCEELQAILQFQKVRETRFPAERIYICGLGRQEEPVILTELRNATGIDTDLLPSDGLISAEPDSGYRVGDYLFATGSLLSG